MTWGRGSVGLVEELERAVATRPGWTVAGDVAVYAPTASDWSARVRAVAAPERVSQSWHAAVLLAGDARHSRLCGTAQEALRWSERLLGTLGSVATPGASGG